MLIITKKLVKVSLQDERKLNRSWSSYTQTGALTVVSSKVQDALSGHSQPRVLRQTRHPVLMLIQVLLRKTHWWCWKLLQRITVTLNIYCFSWEARPLGEIWWPMAPISWPPLRFLHSGQRSLSLCSTHDIWNPKHIINTYAKPCFLIRSQIFFLPVLYSSQINIFFFTVSKIKNEVKIIWIYIYIKHKYMHIFIYMCCYCVIQMYIKII